MGDILNGIFGTKNNFQATAPTINQQNFGNAISQSQQGFNANQGNQTALAQALQAQANGMGPNPALNQLQQTTSQNVNQAASQAASTAGVNPALAARMAVDAGAQANQQAAGQAATLNAQQRLGAQGQLGGLYGQMGTQQLQNQGILQNAQAQQNNTITQGSLGAQGINSGVAQQNANTSGQIGGGILNGIGSFFGLAHGGVVPGFAGGGAVAPPLFNMGYSQPGSNPYANAFTNFGKALRGSFQPTPEGAPAIPTADDWAAYAGAPGATLSDQNASMMGGPSALSRGGKVPGKPKVFGDSESNDTVPAMLSPGEIVIPRTQSKDPDQAKEFIDHLMKSKGQEDSGPKSYGDVVAAHRKLRERVTQLEKKLGKKK